MVPEVGPVARSTWAALGIVTGGVCQSQDTPCSRVRTTSKSAPKIGQVFWNDTAHSFGHTTFWQEPLTHQKPHGACFSWAKWHGWVPKNMASRVESSSKFAYFWANFLGFCAAQFSGILQCWNLKLGGQALRGNANNGASSAW